MVEKVGFGGFCGVEEVLVWLGEKPYIGIFGKKEERGLGDY